MPALGLQEAGVGGWDGTREIISLQQFHLHHPVVCVSLRAGGGGGVGEKDGH